MWAFPKGFIDLYNGVIPTFAATRKQWVKDVDTLAYSRMIPLMVKRFCPPEMRSKISAAAYTMYRVKTIPHKYQSGDCGVYTLKFIEWLALGCGFSGLNDESTAEIRGKYAAEFMDELPEDIISLTDPNPHGEFDEFDEKYSFIGYTTQ